MHRLTRQSPFGSGVKHTSFASVTVARDTEQAPLSIEVHSRDIEVDTFRASGKGGQHVNKTSSAVRLRHLPSGLVVACQAERSQHANRAKAHKLLKERLEERALSGKRLEEKSRHEARPDINFGRQIRSYVLDQSRIKDARTGIVSLDAQAVLDGKLERFLQAAVRERAKSKERRRT